ncbi:hypothetical protein Tco_0801217 [Tanacetum coccineum]|uniref:Uncharacterized protein n=1 Tax=Tanacetum coccineum TaxID=301880 RepID=A0ABQ4ZVD3_9ASTR
MSTLPRRPIHQFHLSPKKSSDLVHSLNRSGWFFTLLHRGSFAQKGNDGEVMFIELIRKKNDSSEGEHERKGVQQQKGEGYTPYQSYTGLINFLVDINVVLTPRDSIYVVLGMKSPPKSKNEYASSRDKESLQ